ncbi:MAG: hypothetical protein IPL87_01245 [Candidatus Moraniibacteriota bacterium]|nr:MAG: hypothetical protein IPL87_01245 [Candidatus Moranbacteria bacterium]
MSTSLLIKSVVQECSQREAIREMAQKIIETVILEKVAGTFSVGEIQPLLKEFRRKVQEENTSLKLTDIPDETLYNEVIRGIVNII